jgi:GNAT superfamily N-acetyltransferase
MLTLRLATEQDLDAVCALLSAQMSEHDVGIEQASLEFAVRGVFADSRRGAIVIALSGQEEVIGVACLCFIWTLEHGGASAWLDELYVRPEHRDRGVGSQLLAHAIEVARAAGCRALDLEVERDHARVVSLYARNGFRAHSRTRFVKPLGSSVRGRDV